MHYVYDYLFLIVWISYFIYWQIKAADIKTSVRTESLLSRQIRAVSIILALLLLLLPDLLVPLVNLKIFSPDRNHLYFWIGFLIAVAGLSFSVMGRKRLGKNWSQAVTIKNDHNLAIKPTYQSFGIRFIQGCYLVLLVHQ